MILKDPELRQIDEDFLRRLKEKDPEALADLSLKLATDLKEARERLNQTPSNSSKPSGSFPLWEKGGTTDDDLSDDEGIAEAASGLVTDKEPSDTEAADLESTDESTPSSDPVEAPPKKRKPGRQEGSQGFGRTQLLPVTHTEHHRPSQCLVCKGDLSPYMGIAYTGFYTVDTLFGELESPGLELTNTHHLYYCTVCPHCDLDNRAYPNRVENDEAWDQVGLTEWRLVGPGLASLIVYLSFELRVSRRKVQRFFDDVFGLKLSVGTLQNVVIESARALEPVEEQRVADLLNESLIHADETAHGEAGVLLWLWVFISHSTALFFIGYRTLEIIDNLLDGHPFQFKGYLMSDGYQVYRHFKNRLRCWAHLIRKAKALCDCYSPESRQYGQQILGLLYEMIKGVRLAREGPDAGKVDISPLYESQRARLRALCERMRVSDHKKTHALGVEFLNDWAAIFRILERPEWPLTNNEAERALRHWVILRRITQGTRSAQGSRALALIASVMETCRLRNASPLYYIRDVIQDRRQGKGVPKLPPVSLNEIQAVGV
jgi:hypothetical protein